MRRPVAASAAWSSLAVALAGCGAHVDATRAFEPGRPAIRVPYRGSGAEARRWPDYGAIDAKVLAPDADRFDAPEAAPAPAPKKGPAPRAGGKK
jgi:hypothetical protein